jgi:hypothetical protein
VSNRVKCDGFNGFSAVLAWRYVEEQRLAHNTEGKAQLSAKVMKMLKVCQG